MNIDRLAWEFREAWHIIKRDWWVIVLLCIAALATTGAFDWIWIR